MALPTEYMDSMKLECNETMMNRDAVKKVEKFELDDLGNLFKKNTIEMKKKLELAKQNTDDLYDDLEDF